MPGSWRIVDNDPRGVCVRSCPRSVVGPTQTAPYGGFCVPTADTIRGSKVATVGGQSMRKWHPRLSRVCRADSRISSEVRIPFRRPITESFTSHFS